MNDDERVGAVPVIVGSIVFAFLIAYFAELFMSSLGSKSMDYEFIAIFTTVLAMVFIFAHLEDIIADIQAYHERKYLQNEQNENEHIAGDNYANTSPNMTEEDYSFDEGFVGENQQFHNENDNENGTEIPVR